MNAAVLTISTKGFLGQRQDESGIIITTMLEEAGYMVTHRDLLPDNQQQIAEALTQLADAKTVNLIITTGGTGFSQSDVTPEATSSIIERFVPGIPEAMRRDSLQYTNRGILSRGVAGIRGYSLIINLPGSAKAVRENLSSVLPALKHGIQILIGEAHDCGQPTHQDVEDTE